MRTANFRLFLCLCVFLFTVGCASNKESVESSDAVVVQTFKKKSDRFYSNVTLLFLEDEDRNARIPGMYHVNGIMFPPQMDTSKVELLLKESGVYSFRVGQIGKDWIDFKTKIEQGDSTIIKFYLKVDDEMLY